MARKSQEIRRGCFTAKLYFSNRKTSGRKYRIVRLAYIEPGGRRLVRDFGSEDKARAAAKKASSAYAAGRPDALAFSGAERAEYDACKQALDGKDVSLYEAVQGYLTQWRPG
jgi:hypothetical protein